MKKILILALLFSCISAKPQVNLVALFDNAQEGEVITIPPGFHTITESLKPKSWQVIYGNNAVIQPTGTFPVFDFTGVSRVTSHNLKTHESTENALLLSRHTSGHGANNRFYDCWLEGLTLVESEGNRFYNCTFLTRNANPALIYNGSNTGDTWRDFAFLNYGTEENVSLVQLGQTVSGLVFDGGYFALGVNGTAFEITGAASTITIRNIRVEGTGTDSLLLDNTGSSSLYQYHIEKVNWTIPSDYMIHAPRIMHECNLDFIWGSAATRYVHVDGGTSKLWRCFIKGNKVDWVTLTGGAQLRMNHLYWTQGNPLPSVGDNVVEWTP